MPFSSTKAGSLYNAADLSEQLAKRTRTSRTYVGPNDEQIVRVFPEAINYQLPNGSWRAIDNDLVDSPSPAHAWRNAANRFTADLPADVAGSPVRVAAGSHWLTMKPRGAEGDGVVSDEAIRYASVLPGVDLEYVASEDSLKEDIILKGPSAPHTYRFDVDASADLTAHKTSSGAVEFRDRKGVTAFMMTPPFMYDKRGISQGRSEKVDLNVERVADRFVVTVDADDEWLDSPDRRFPVRIDPTVVIGGAGTTCTLVGGWIQDQSKCAVPYMDIGFDGFEWSHPEGQANRALLKFDLSAIPAGSQILDANLGAYLYDGAPPTGLPVSAHRVTTAWTQSATWNKPSTATSWAARGGDYAAEAEDIRTVLGTNHFEYWNIPELVQDWKSGAVPNEGVMLKSAEVGNVNTIHTFASSNDGDVSVRPRLEVAYQPPVFDDRAPSAPTNLDYDFNNEGSNTTELSWTSGIDGPNSNNTAGSGFAFDEYRTQETGEAWSSWRLVSDDELGQVAGLVSGDVLKVEVRSVDAKGNRSIATAATFTMPSVFQRLATAPSWVATKCYRESAAYAFPYRGPDPDPDKKTATDDFSQPDCRQAPGTTEDATLGRETANTFAFEPRPLFRENPSEGSRRKWAIKDSFNDVFAWISMIRKPGQPDAFRVYDQDGSTLLGRTLRPDVEIRIQGRACMETESLEQGNLMISLFAADFGYGPKRFATQTGTPGAVYLGVRGFVNQDAFAATGLGSGKTYRNRSTASIADEFDVNCTQESVGLKESTTEQSSSGPLNAVFRFDDRYKGESNRRGGGNRYSNYNGFPEPNQYTFGTAFTPEERPANPVIRPDIVRVVKLMSTTTGVGGGGVVRAIISPSRAFKQFDRFAYRDPNVVCEPRVTPTAPSAPPTVRFPAQWRYIKLTGTPRAMEGWVPDRVPTPTERPCNTPLLPAGPE